MLQAINQERSQLKIANDKIRTLTAKKNNIQMEWERFNDQIRDHITKERDKHKQEMDEVERQLIAAKISKDKAKDTLKQAIQAISSSDEECPGRSVVVGRLYAVGGFIAALVDAT